MLNSVLARREERPQRIRPGWVEISVKELAAFEVKEHGLVSIVRHTMGQTGLPSRKRLTVCPIGTHLELILRDKVQESEFTSVRVHRDPLSWQLI
jgi:hypothetical protein